MADVSSDTKVVVTDVQIPFGSMVVLMVKWALAAVPAIFILWFLFVVVLGLLSVPFYGR